MRHITTVAFTAALLVGASSFAMAGQPGYGEHGQNSAWGQPQNSASQGTLGQQAAPGVDNQTSSPGLDQQPNASKLNSPAGLSGSSTPPVNEGQMNSRAQVKQQLQAEGYTDIHNVHKNQNGWTAEASKNGQQVAVNVDHSGRVETQQ